MKTGVLITMLFPVMVMHAQLGKLVWEENFNTNKIDTTFWNFETGTGVNGDWGTGQLDRATDRKQNVSLKKNVKGADSSCLMITTRAEEFMDRNYTSGRINTKGKASWGPGHRIVARVYAQDVKSMGQGFAFWMLPDEQPEGQNHMMWPQGGEIDIMEYVGSIPFHNLGSVHYAWSYENNEWQSWNHAHQGFYYSFKDQEVPSPAEPGYGNYPPPKNDTIAGSKAFHDYGINWYADRIEFFVDSTVYHIHYLNDGGSLSFEADGENEDAIEKINGKRTGISEYSNHFPEWHPYEHKMYLILSAGVGGSKNTYGGPIDSSAKFPCSVFVDWVRVYEL
jgi:beta-glucanase (GH16 family)